jgi:hypothetical protein
MNKRNSLGLLYFFAVSCTLAAIAVGCAKGSESSNSCPNGPIEICKCQDGSTGSRQCQDGNYTLCQCGTTGASGTATSTSPATGAGGSVTANTSTGAGGNAATTSAAGGTTGATTQGASGSTGQTGAAGSTGATSPAGGCPSNMKCEANDLLNGLLGGMATAGTGGGAMALKFCTDPAAYQMGGIVGPTPPICATKADCEALGLASAQCMDVLGMFKGCLTMCTQ